MEMKIDVIGVPIDLGASRRGVDMAPAPFAMRIEKTAAGYGPEYGQVEHSRDIIEYDEETPKDRAYKQINRVNEMLAEQVATACKIMLSVVLGGDHSIAVGTVCVQRK